MTRTRVVALGTTLWLVTACAGGAAPVLPSGPERAQPWPDRPVVELAFTVADDLTSVSGREHLTFTPDAPVCELVLRLWPNQPGTARTGSGLTLTSAVVDGEPVRPQISAAGATGRSTGGDDGDSDDDAGDDADNGGADTGNGTLAELPLGSCRDAGEPIEADLEFQVALGEDAAERMGHDPEAGVAWFGTAFPLLSWVRGEGWTRDEAVSLGAEAVVSEEFRLADLSVSAPTGQKVVATGSPAGTEDAAGRTTHHFTADSVRDVSIAVGAYDVLEREMAGVPVSLAIPASGTQVDPEEWADTIEEMLAALQSLLGEFPALHLTAAIAPPQGDDGVEFPESLQFGDVGSDELRPLVAHELAHQWFYSLVGNNQARDPWLDESFATFAEAIATGRESQFPVDDTRPGAQGHLGEPMSYWDAQGDFDQYEEVVYLHGAAVLIEARNRVGADRFDAALRTYLAVNAHRVAGPADVEAAFADLPEVLDLLTESGALRR